MKLLGKVHLKSWKAIIQQERSELQVPESTAARNIHYYHTMLIWLVSWFDRGHLVPMKGKLNATA